MTRKRNESGQALIEIAVLLPLLAIFALGIVDVSRAAYDAEVIKNLSGEGSNLASRGTTPANTVTAVINDSDIPLSSSGCVIVSAVTCTTNSSGQCTGYVITGQAISAQCNGNSSRVGCYPASQTCTASATVPTQVQTVLSTVPGYTVYATEVFFDYTSVTDLGNFLTTNNWLPTHLYSAAYY